MKYVKRYNKFSIQTNCRICLTQSVSKMIDLDAPLKGILMPKPLVYEAIETVMSEKINLSEKLPRGVCAVCAELLKIAYDLKVQYHQSQKSLKQQLKQLGELTNSEGDAKKDKDSKALVEILVGSERFNIHDLLIVEEEHQNDEMFEGFLNNLGKSISASIVKKGYKKPKPILEVPSLVIEKVHPEPEKDLENEDDSQTEKEIYLETSENTYDEHFEEPNADIDNNEENDEIFFDTPVDDKIVEKFVTLTDNDKEILESAMNFKYKCPYCEKPMSSLKKVKLHSRSCRKNNLNARCYVCGVSFEFRGHLLKHLKQAHLVGMKKAQNFKEAEKHKCNVCDKVLRSNGSLFYHMSKHLGRRYGCDKCDKRFYTRSQAANHRQTHNRDDTLVVCPICGKGFHYQSGLFYHMKMHTNERNYQCSFCPRRFYTRNSLKRHELTHTGGRPYACTYCEKKFRSLGEVKKHKLLHTGERPFQCKYCHLGFTQAHNLKVHLMTHPGSFHCIHCSKGFAEQEILRFHLRNKHGINKTLQEEEDELQTEEEMETLEQDEEDSSTIDDKDEVIPEKEIILDGEQEYFITEEYVDDEEKSIVHAYEVRDEVLVETVEEENLQ